MNAMTMIRIGVWAAAAAWMLCACAGDAKEKPSEEEGVATLMPQEKNEVTVMTLERRDFEHQLVSNGKVTAGELADLKFEQSGVVVRIAVKNGDRVSRGTPIAELDKFKWTDKTRQAKEALEKAKLELKDVLIGQGYAQAKEEDVPEAVMKLARVKSGYDQCVAQYELALHEEERTTLVAPFGGVVANLFAKPYNEVDMSKPFCTIVGRGMEVDFSVLESELALVKRGDKAMVTPYAAAGVSLEGRIAEINPLVDEQGMVRVKATVESDGRLFSGMNVKVQVHRSLGQQLVVPKSAVVLRSGRQVVFTLKDGKAMWNYVTTGLENAESYSLTGDNLKEGDVVIVTGNVNLAHEAPVEVVGR